MRKRLKRRFIESTRFIPSLNFHNFYKYNPCWLSDQLVVNFNLAKNGWAKRSKKREAKLRVKNKNLRYFDAKLRFALLASLRSAIFIEIKMNKLLVTLPARVKNGQKIKKNDSFLIFF